MKESFILYTQFYESIVELTNEQAGEMLKALFVYSITEEEPNFTGILKMAWIPIRQQIDRAAEKYEKKAGSNRSNGQLGGRPKKNEGETENPTVISTTEEETKKPNGLNNNHVVISETQTETQKPNGYFDNPNVLVPVNVHVNDNVNATTANADSSAPEAAAANFEFQKEKILEFWNCNCKRLPIAVKLTTKRGAALQRLFDIGYTLDEISDCMALANQIATLNGSKPTTSGKLFCPTFDWVVNDSNFVTLYEQLTSVPRETDQQHWELAEKKRRDIERPEKMREDGVINLKAKVSAEMKTEKGDVFNIDEYETG